MGEISRKDAGKDFFAIKREDGDEVEDGEGNIKEDNRIGKKDCELGRE